MRPKSGVVEFKSQRQINEDRQRKTQAEYDRLKREVTRILRKNYKIAESVGK
ncbi:hypothetical protein [Fictibacillus phosphorivorans]|uniref:hypothetical protein n=1 Tax=Fictibacillus phosphorivorans TaxID=1221500 RepID=UPI000AD9E176|nr:hypothetical protein [Fictibacillus phosphorivorans]